MYDIFSMRPSMNGHLTMNIRKNAKMMINIAFKNAIFAIETQFKKKEEAQKGFKSIKVIHSAVSSSWAFKFIK